MSIKLPESVIAAFEADVSNVLRSGNLAEGAQARTVEGKISRLIEKTSARTQPESVLMCSNGAGLFTTLQFYKSRGATDVVIQSNTMYGIKTLCNLVGLDITVVPSSPLFEMDHHELSTVLHDLNTAGKNPVVIYSHIGGGIGYNIKVVAQVCLRTHTPLIEDCAHTLGAQTELYGDALVFSFYATKAVPAGEGGVLVSSNSELIDFARRFIQYDRNQMQFDIGLNLRVSEISALMISKVLDSMDHIVTNRLKTWSIYEDACNKAGIKVYKAYLGTQHNGYKFIIDDLEFVHWIDSVRDSVSSGIETVGVPPLDGVLTGLVFGYSLSDADVIPHVCFNTNYEVDSGIVFETLQLINSYTTSRGV